MQASVKTSAVLNCYEAEKNKGNDVTIVLPHVLGETKKFIDSLHLDAQIVVIDSLGGMLYRFPFNIIRIKRAIRKMGIDNNTNFYFTDVNDVEIGLLLPYLHKCHPTQILTSIDIKDGQNYQIDRKSSNLKTKIKATVLSILYNTHFIAVLDNGKNFIYTYDKVFNLPKIDYSDTSIIKRYKIKLTSADGSIIFYTSPYVDAMYNKDEFDRINSTIIQTLQDKGYKVFAKGHPRLGNPEIVEKMADVVIPSYIPGEYLDLSSFVFAIGIFSTAIATVCEEIKSYSILKLGKMKDENIRTDYLKYLMDINPNVYILSSLDEIPIYDKK